MSNYKKYITEEESGTIIENGASYSPEGSYVERSLCSYGTWVPVIDSGATYTSQWGCFSRMGNTVTVSFYLKFTATSTTALSISGLPYAPGGICEYAAGGGRGLGLKVGAGYRFAGYFVTGGKISPRKQKANATTYNLDLNTINPAIGDVIELSGTIVYTTNEEI